MLSELKQFLKKYPPENMPFWPHARYTTPFGLRTSQKVLDMGGSPGHLATDRSDDIIRNLLMPFPGWCFWEYVGGVAGSLAKMISNEIQLELQIFHTKCALQSMKPAYEQGESLPIFPSDLGLSDGIHTHTVGVMPYSDDVADWIRDYSQKIDDDYIYDHCQKYNLNEANVKKRLSAQMLSWGIIELWDNFAIRRGMPQYLTPEWGPGPVIVFNTRWLLQI